MSEPYIDYPKEDYPNIEICTTALLAEREYCFHQPPLEMSLKLVGK